ncbi:type IV pilus modification PilV family protein [Desulfosediminicola sp.]|uniref:type IV pilus modification PilV family protein n=1 Tax=Desulfosediminicola sp. TaxID=2886825 RepID=UPI003AF20AC1
MSIRDTSGFTLIEVLIAIVVFGVGILSLVSMQVAGIKGNARAERITVASDWGSDQIEQLFSLEYDDPDLVDDNSITNTAINADSTAGLNSFTDTTADGKRVSPDGYYTIYWNVAENVALPNTKTIRVLVVRAVNGGTRTVTMNYLKAKYL